MPRRTLTSPSPPSAPDSSRRISGGPADRALFLSQAEIAPDNDLLLGNLRPASAMAFYGCIQPGVEKFRRGNYCKRTDRREMPNLRKDGDCDHYFDGSPPPGRERASGFPCQAIAQQFNANHVL